MDERTKIRWVALLVIVAVLAVIGWFFGMFQVEPLIVTTVIV